MARPKGTRDGAARKRVLYDLEIAAASPSEIATAHGVARTTAFATLSRLLDTGLVCRVGGTYSLTTKGRLVVSHLRAIDEIEACHEGD